ncbi:hypothetical protein K402DRAFT_382904 [Aulographum hederae CBS 113979]|uniref:Mitochondrial import inner membrane translocase subunit n=1 Tax=Aulographum hederae CBS 113979 TaxID=1176131 RepID=A0A6G1GRK4_9PEZI|nr:hypothetical protein K402DRAFT_382904 [Aulographum hederae CBS 113979]
MSISGGGNVDLTKLSENDKQELQHFVMMESQKSQIQSAIHSLTDTCFRKCVSSKISVGTLDKYEEPCMTNCVERFMDANKLVLGQLEKLRSTTG